MKYLQNDQATNLKTPWAHFVVDHEFKHVEKPFPSVAAYMVWVRADLANRVSSILCSRVNVLTGMPFTMLL